MLLGVRFIPLLLVLVPCSSLFVSTAMGGSLSDEELKQEISLQVQRQSNLENGFRPREEVVNHVILRAKYHSWVQLIHDPKPQANNEFELPKDIYVQGAVRFFQARIDEGNHYYHSRVFFAKIIIEAMKYYIETDELEKGEALFESGFRVAMSLTDDSQVKAQYLLIRDRAFPEIR